MFAEKSLLLWLLDTQAKSEHSQAYIVLLNTVAALAEKAVQSDKGATFIVAIKPKDLPEYWEE